MDFLGLLGGGDFAGADGPVGVLVHVKEGEGRVGNVGGCDDGWFGGWGTYQIGS